MPQPQHHSDDRKVRILRRAQVEERTGLACSSIYGLMAKGKFPKPVQLSEHTVGWIEAEVAAWLAERIAERDRPQARRGKQPKRADAEAAP